MLAHPCPNNDRNIIKQVSWDKSSSLLKIQKQNTQTLQIFTMQLKWKVYTKVIKMPSWKAQIQRPSGLIKWREVQVL